MINIAVGQEVWFIGRDYHGGKDIISGRVISFDAETICLYVHYANHDGVINLSDGVVEFRSFSEIYLRKELINRSLLDKK